MLHYATGDNKYRGLHCGNEGELYPPRYRFGWDYAKSGCGRSALHRANSYLKNLIQSIAEAKVGRMRRELELRGVHFDGSNEEWVPNSLRKGNEAK